MENEVLHKEIDLIQSCINRMANNSFLLKGWAISLLAVVFALADNGFSSIKIYLIVLIPFVSFWYLDAFFLRIERMYREMYLWVLEKRKNNDDSMLYDLNPYRFKYKVDSIWQVMCSVTLRWFYGFPVVISIIIIVFQLKCGGK